MNLTLAVDEKVAENARKAARAMGKSLNQVVREYLERLAGTTQIDANLEELRRTSGLGNSRGSKFTRDEIYSERLGRSSGGRRRA